MPKRLAVVLVLLLLPAVLLLLSPEVASATEERFQRAYSVEGVRQVSVENVNGRISIRSWDRPYVRVIAVKSAHRSETLRRTEIRVSLRNRELRIETVSPRRRRLFGFLSFGDGVARVEYEIFIPAQIECAAETVNGRVEIEGLDGQARADTVNGGIALASVSGPVKAHTVNGSIDLSFRGNLRSSELRTVNGSIEVSFPRSSSVRYSLETVNGRIDAEGEMNLEVTGKFGPKEARGSYNGGSEQLAAETVNGSVRLRPH